jgi:hypothetical protein
MRTSSAMLDPVTAAWNTVAHFDSYEDARRAVGQLSEYGFPIDKLDIVTAEVRLIEPVTRRPGRIRATVTRLLRIAAVPGREPTELASVRALTTHRYNLVAREGTAGRAWTLLHKAGLESRPTDSQPALAGA